jgi:hypothetical protein
MKRTLAVSLLAAALALAAGCATTPPAERQVAASATKPASTALCVQETGSRIKQKPGECIGAGRTYSQEDLERTGAFTSAEALEKLDPGL